MLGLEKEQSMLYQPPIIEEVHLGCINGEWVIEVESFSSFIICIFPMLSVILLVFARLWRQFLSFSRFPWGLWFHNISIGSDPTSLSSLCNRFDLSGPTGRPHLSYCVTRHLKVGSSKLKDDSHYLLIIS